MRMLNEPYLQRAALLQADGKTLLSIGYQPQLTWPKITANSGFIVPCISITTPSMLPKFLQQVHSPHGW
jgi:hypothetical protein